MADRAIQTVFADRLKSFKEDFVPKVAALRRPVLGNVPVSKDERRRRWWQEDKGWTPEHEQMLLLALDPNGNPLLDANGQPKTPMTPEDVGLLKYPNRELDAKAFGRGDERAAAKYAQEMSALGPPEPDPLETAAQQVQGSAHDAATVRPVLGMGAARPLAVDIPDAQNLQPGSPGPIPMSAASVPVMGS